MATAGEGAGGEGTEETKDGPTDISKRLQQHDEEGEAGEDDDEEEDDDGSASSLSEADYDPSR